MRRPLDLLLRSGHTVPGTGSCAVAALAFLYHSFQNGSTRHDANDHTHESCDMTNTRTISHTFLFSINTSDLAFDVDALPAPDSETKGSLATSPTISKAGCLLI